jgi:hypothetical protein
MYFYLVHAFLVQIIYLMVYLYKNQSVSQNLFMVAFLIKLQHIHQFIFKYVNDRLQLLEKGYLYYVE